MGSGRQAWAGNGFSAAACFFLISLGFIRRRALPVLARLALSRGRRWRVLRSLGIDLASAARLSQEADAGLPDEPDEKIYNEGVFLLNEKRDSKEAIKTLRGSRTASILIRNGRARSC